MNRFLFLLTFLSLLTNTYAQKEYKYPVAPKDSIVDVYFEDSITDPYQWMEDPKDPRFEDWFKSQRKITNREQRKHNNKWTLKEQIASMYYGVRNKKIKSYKEQADSLNSKYEFKFKETSRKRTLDLVYRSRGRKNYKKLVSTKDLGKGSDDNIAIVGRVVNEDEDLIAVQISRNGSDWIEVYFYDLVTGQKSPHVLRNLRVSSSIIWKGKDIIYDGYTKPKSGRELLDKATGQKLFYHKLASKQSEDKLLYQNPDTTGTNKFQYFELNDKLFFKHYLKVRGKTYRALSNAIVTDKSCYLSNFLIYPNSKDLYFNFEELFDDTVVLNTNWGAPNGRVLTVNIKELNKVTELIPEYDILLSNVNKLGRNKLACIYNEKGRNVSLIFNLEGEFLKKIDFPQGKKLNYFYENNDNATHTDFCISSFYHPDLWYQIALEDLTFKPSNEISVPYKAETLETRYVNYTSKDSTEVSMYITCLKDTKLDGSNPTLLYGYGGYGVTVRPRFEESLTLWLLHGGIIAVPNVRGGGAKGSDWANAGRRLNKQTAIDDFIAAADYLVDQNYTKPSKLAINGGSHGGLLVAAAMMQRPELFKAVIAEAGVYDMLRFEKFTVGAVNVNSNEFGNTSNLEDYVNLRSYSPLHNIQKGKKYPNLLLITGSNDDRVPPFHSYKFLATLQEKASNESLYEVLVINGSGHGGALTNADFTIKTMCKYSFLFRQLDVKIF